MIQTIKQLRKDLPKTRLARILTAPLEPVLNLSRGRLIGVALFFGLLWTYAYPQHYENMPARIAATLLAVPILLATPSNIKESARWRWYVISITLLTGPAFLI